MSIIAIFVICSIVEYLEKPFFAWVDKKEKYIELCNKYSKILL